MDGNGRSWAIAAALMISACAPPVDGPIDRQRAIDRDDGDRLAAQLAQLPGVVRAEVVLHHARRDPLAMTAPVPATVAAVISVDDRADHAAIRGAATRLTRAAVPELPASAAPTVEIHTTVHRPVVARVGPFLVEESSRAPLKTTLALGCLAIAGLAGAIAWRAARHRRGTSAQ